MSITLGELASTLDAELIGDGDYVIEAAASLESATPACITFAGSDQYRKFLATTRAGAVILRPEDSAQYRGNRLLLDDPHLAFARAVALLNPAPALPRGMHATAIVDSSASVPVSCSIGANVVIEAGAELGERVVIGAGSFVGHGVTIGTDSRIDSNVSLYAGTRLGERVVIHAGAAVGAEGFGYTRDGANWVAVPQVGGVRIGDDVRIGANTTIDRGALDDTVIERGVKIDNLVQIAHNVRVGEDTIMAGCVAIAGSCRIGKRCMFGGRVGVTDHVEIADDVQVMATSLVSHSIWQAGTYSSVMPLDENRSWRRNAARFKSLDRIARRLRDLERKIESLLQGGKP